MKPTTADCFVQQLIIHKRRRVNKIRYYLNYICLQYVLKVFTKCSLQQLSLSLLVYYTSLKAELLLSCRSMECTIELC